MTAFASVIASAFLGNLRYLGLDSNRIGGAGIVNFSNAIAWGALASLKKLTVDDGPLGADQFIHSSIQHAKPER